MISDDEIYDAITKIMPIDTRVSAQMLDFAKAIYAKALEDAAKVCEETYVEPGDLQVMRCTDAAEKSAQ